VRPVVVTSALSAAAAGVGGLGTRTDTRWFRRLDKPSWQPPAVAFPVVWTGLYALIAWGTGRAAQRAGEDAGPRARQRVLALTAADLTVNAAWCWAFFARESAGGGLATIVVLDALNVALLRECAEHDRAAAAALAPYVAWSTFATALNAEIWRRNR
jgi:tryptophan-rich sensory protein